jgi:hypothetical protein
MEREKLIKSDQQQSQALVVREPRLEDFLEP